jgi:hypothetical protein
MTKENAFKLIYQKFDLKLNSGNTNLSNINANGIWSMEPNCIRKAQKLYLLLNNNYSSKIHVFEIPANHEVYNKLYSRKDRNVYRLLFNVSDTNFIETLQHINFKNFYKGFIEY